jgi:mono/diheme cytochrome c family protein
MTTGGRHWPVWGLVALALTTGSVVPAAEPEAAYREQCAPCHGESGRGDGPDASIFTQRPRNLRDGVLDRYPVGDLVRSVRDGKPLALELDPKAMRERAGEVEALVAHLRRLPSIDWDVVEPGEEQWVARCELCHGPAGRPPDVLPPGVQRRPRDLSDPVFQRGVSDAELAELVRHGRDGMPAIPGLTKSDADVRALVAYVRLLSPGRIVYERYCASCHGEDGRADDIVDPGFAPTFVFDRAYLARQDPEVLRRNVWHMLARQRPAMPHLRERLSEAEARAIIDYVKRMP